MPKAEVTAAQFEILAALMKHPYGGIAWRDLEIVTRARHAGVAARGLSDRGLVECWCVDGEWVRFWSGRRQDKATEGPNTQFVRITPAGRGAYLRECKRRAADAARGGVKAE